MCEVFTDKLVAKIPSTADGIVKKVNFSIDDICAVGHALLEIESETGAGTPGSAAQTPPKEKEVEAAVPQS